MSIDIKNSIVKELIYLFRYVDKNNGKLSNGGHNLRNFKAIDVFIMIF